MNGEKTTEMVETDAEVLDGPEPEEAGSELTLDQMAAVIQVSNRLEEYAKAMDRVVGVIIKRAYPGDFVVHAKEGDPDDKKRANIGAAAAERIAAFLGIKESNWRDRGKEWSEDRKHYTYSYEADFTFASRTIHAVGRAGTRDRFFGKEHGKWKPLEEVQEDHIRTAAFRACRKEGVRAILGLRAIPGSKLRELGFDLGKLVYAGFESGSKAIDPSTVKKDEATGQLVAKIRVKSLDMKEGKTAAGKPWRRWDVLAEDGVRFIMWVDANKDESNRVTLLSQAKVNGQESEVIYQVNKTQRGESYQIIKVNGEVDV